MIQEYLYPNTFQLESGQQLDQLKIAYTVYGNPTANKTVWVCHALSGNSLVSEWWGGLFGKNRLFNFEEYSVICANVIGSCYGSTGADELDNCLDFPLVTVRDMVNAHMLLRSHLKLEKIDILIGASLGGQQALEWAILEPKCVGQLILIACNAAHSALGRALNETQRLALLADPTFGKQFGGYEGLKTARAIAMISYRSYTDFELKQNDVDFKYDDFKASSYVRYQGEKFQNRFKPGAYYTLTKAMDAHDVGRGRISRQNALQEITARTLVVGIDSDVLFPLVEQEFLAAHIQNAELAVLHSVHGHDAFLINYDQLENIIKAFLNKQLVSKEADATLLYKKQPTRLKPQLDKQ